MKLLITLTFISLAQLLKAQDSLYLNNRSDTIHYLINKIVENGSASFYNPGIATLYSMQFYRFGYLFSMVSNDELVDIAKTGHSSIRVFAFMGLCQNNFGQLEELRQILKSASTEVRTTEGCIGKKSTVSKIVTDITKPYWAVEMNYYLFQLHTDSLYRKAIIDYILSD